MVPGSTIPATKVGREPTRRRLSKEKRQKETYRSQECPNLEQYIMKT